MRASSDAAGLRYAVRLTVLSKFFGQLWLVVAVLTAVPFVAALWFDDATAASRYGLVIVGLTGIGTMLSRVSAPRRVQANEGMVVVVLVFLATPLIMTYPLMSAGLSFIDALFEAVSASTTTGLSTLTSVENAPPTFLFARAWMQWYGGLGIVVLSLALIIEPGLASKGLGVTESAGDDLLGGLKAYSRHILFIYSVLTIISAVGLWLLGAGLWDALEYAMAAVSTGGFSPHDHSLGGLDTWGLRAAVIVIGTVCSVPIILYHRAFRRRLRYDTNGAQVVALLSTAFVVSLVLGGWNIVQGMDGRQAMEQASLLAFSAQTTAGFSATDVSALDSFSKLFLTLAMITGGSTGSTAGGFKIFRFLILLRLVSLMVRRTAVTQHAFVTPRLANRRLEQAELREALLIVILFVAVVVFSWLPFVALGHDAVDSLFEVVSATGTVGLSAGMTATDLPLLLKGILCIDMWLGRLEIIAWLVFIQPGTWIGRRMEEP